MFVQRAPLFAKLPFRVVSRHARLVPLFNMKPQIGNETFIAPNATVIGKADIGKNSAIWYGAVVRCTISLHINTHFLMLFFRRLLCSTNATLPPVVYSVALTYLLTS